VTRIRASALSAIGGCSLLLLASCSADAASEGSRLGVQPMGHDPRVLGGQTGALMPPCGLTPASRMGIPGGDSGIVIHTASCVGYAAAELELRDERGMPVEFDLVPLPGGAVLLRPRMPLPAGRYRLKIAGMEVAPVVAAEPPELPMRLGTLLAVGPPACAGNVELNIDPLVAPYLPQLKLSVSIDGGADLTWFDYGELDVVSGRANLSLPQCIEQSCVTDGAHALRVTGELAGELGTLEPVDVSVQTLCQSTTNAASASAPSSEGDGSEAMDCGVAKVGRGPVGDCALHGLWAALGLLGLRRARRSSA
jgi:hypothetical protein